MVLQHPDAAPLKLALEMSGIVALNGNQTRVTYTVNTEGGSSGSPCFNTDWELIALHHSGDPNFDRRDKPTCNQGIPFAAIMALLAKRGKLQDDWGTGDDLNRSKPQRTLRTQRIKQRDLLLPQCPQLRGEACEAVKSAFQPTSCRILQSASFPSLSD